MLGVSGFAGSHLRREAQAAGFRVVGASRRPVAGDLACDLLDPESVRAAIRAAQPEMVANMAGSASVAASWKSPEEAFATNTTGVGNLLAAISAEAPEAHVLCASSAEVYGAAIDLGRPLTEDLPLAPVNPYGASKAAMEVLCRNEGASRGLRIAVVRSFNQLGPGQSEKFVASGFARQIALAEAGGAGEVTLAVGNLAAARDFTDVRDGARAFLRISEAGLTGAFNVCSGRAVPLEALLEAMRSSTTLVVDTRVAPELVRPVDVPVVVGSPERLHEATGWEPQIPLRQSIADLLDWWRSEMASRASAAAPGAQI